MLEALIVAIFLIIAFFCVVGTAGLYKAKVVAMQDSRYRAMHNATNNCDVSGKAYASVRPPTLFDEVPATPGGFSPKLAVDFVRTIQEGGGVSRAQISGYFSFGPPPEPPPYHHVDPPKPLVKPIAGSVESHSFVLCNERAAGINLATVVISVFDDVRSTFAQSIGPQLGDLVGL